MATRDNNARPISRKIRKRRAKLRSWWYGTPDNEKAMTFMGWGIALVAIAVTAWFTL